MCTAIIKRRRACPCGTYTCTGRSTDLDPIWRQPVIWRGCSISGLLKKYYFVRERGEFV